MRVCSISLEPFTLYPSPCICALPTNGTIIKLKVLPAVAAQQRMGKKE